MIKKILVSQPKPTSEKSPYFDIENKTDVKFTFHSFIKIEGLSAREFRQQKIQILDYSAIVFTSRHSVDFFFTLCKEMRVALPEDMKYFGLSEAVSLYNSKIRAVSQAQSILWNYRTLARTRYRDGKAQNRKVSCATV